MDSHTRLPGPLILLVDDSADTRSLYAEYFRSVGFRVEMADNGNSAVALTLALGPGLVVMDLDMPGLDGWEAARLIRSYRSTQPVPIVALSGLSDNGSVMQAMSAGCDRFVPKPCMPEDLEQVVRATLRQADEKRVLEVHGR